MRSWISKAWFSSPRMSSKLAGLHAAIAVVIVLPCIGSQHQSTVLAAARARPRSAAAGMGDPLGAEAMDQRQPARLVGRD